MLAGRAHMLVARWGRSREEMERRLLTHSSLCARLPVGPALCAQLGQTALDLVGKSSIARQEAVPETKALLEAASWLL